MQRLLYVENWKVHKMLTSTTCGVRNWKISEKQYNFAADIMRMKPAEINFLLKEKRTAKIHQSVQKILAVF